MSDIRAELKKRFYFSTKGVSGVKSTLRKLDSIQIDWLLTQGFIERYAPNPRFFSITNLGLEYVDSTRLYNSAYEMQNSRAIELFRECWKNNDFTACTSRQRKDFKELGFVKYRSNMYYLPTLEGCEILGISPEEGERVYRDNLEKFHSSPTRAKELPDW